VILIPEIARSFEHICHKILERDQQGKRFTLIVAAEGAMWPDGGMVMQDEPNESRGQVRLGGIGSRIAKEIEHRLHRETRVCVLGHLQRGGAPTTFDRVLATQFGAHAVRLVWEGRLGEMVCYQPPHITSVPIIEAVNRLSTVDPESSAVQAARALGISFGDCPTASSPFQRPCRQEAALSTCESLVEQAALIA
jgi:6-phosphofructokinase 1